MIDGLEKDWANHVLGYHGVRSPSHIGRNPYERAFDYWGQATNVNIGRNNFDELRFAYFRDGAAGPGGTQSRRNRLAH